MRLKVNKIGSKLLLYFFVFILFTTIIGSVSFLFYYQISSFYALQNQVDQLIILNTKIQKAEQSFLARDVNSPQFHQSGTSSQILSLDSYNREVRRLVGLLQGNSHADQFDFSHNLNLLDKDLKDRQRVFREIAALYKQRGFQNTGLEGELLGAVRELEEISAGRSIVLKALRPHEKDFLHWKDLKFADKLNQEASFLRKLAQDSTNIFIPAQKARLDAINGALNHYLASFKRIVHIEQEIGLDAQSGHLGKLYNINTKLDQALIVFNDQVREKVAAEVADMRSTFFIYLLSLIVLGSLIALWVSYSFSRPIVILNRVARSVTFGLRNQEQYLEAPAKRKDELGSLARNFRTMLNKLRNAIQQAKERNDKLEEFAKNETLRSWHSEGLTIFNEIFRNHHESPEHLAFEIISELVKYTQSNQGGLFVVQHEVHTQSYLELLGCYAYERKKYQQKRVEWGEGLIGTAWREGHPIVITDIPQDYVHITSGLGKARPNCLLIMPIRSDEEIEGVIELISFKEYEDHEIEFIDALALRIGNAMVAARAGQKTRELLARSKKIAEEAQEKESNLQKKLEEYQSWTEEFQSKLKDAYEETLIYQSIVGKAYAGIIITDEKFRITRINEYVAKRFNYRTNDLVGEPLDVLIETDYENILDLKDKRFELNFKSFNQNVQGTLIDSQGNSYLIETISGKLDIDNKVIYIFLFNELSADNREEPRTGSGRISKLKVAS